MNYKFLIHFVSFFLALNFHNCVQAELNLSDELSNCDYTYIESQLETLKTGNEFLKLRFEILELQMDKQKDLLLGLDKKLDRLSDSLQGMEDRIKVSAKENDHELKDMVTKQNQIIQSHHQKPPVDDKLQMLIDIKQIVKTHDSLFKTFDEKFQSIEDGMKKPSWENQFQQLRDYVYKNLPTLQNIDKKVTVIESFNRNVQEHFSCPIHPYPTSCADSDAKYCANNKCRIYNPIYGTDAFSVPCDDHTDGGGWTVIQRRIDGSVDFYRDWSDYKVGFGNIDGEYFIGLDKLHALTTTLHPVELLIQLKDFNDTLKYAKYDEFRVANETEKYKLLKVGKYTGDAGDSFSQHQGYNFTTKDRDNDVGLNSNCAIDKTGAWWYEKCMWSNLNGKYFPKDAVILSNDSKRGICWHDFHGYLYSMKFAQMLIRPKKQ